MRIFVFEFVTGGGLLDDPAPADSLLAEGAAMATSVACDLAQLPDANVVLLRDHRVHLANLDQAPCDVVHSRRDLATRFDAQAAAADATWIIAPEFDEILLDWTTRAERLGSLLLSPGSEFIRLTSNKQRTAELLAEHGISVVSGQQLSGGEAFPSDMQIPSVLKPIDGAGSLGIRFVNSRSESVPAGSQVWRLEPFVPGTPCSVSVLCGPGPCFQTLPACQQLLAADGFAYQGGHCPLPPALDERARRLALAAVKTLPHPIGYVGVDLILGSTSDASKDYVIEINPRLTTSYVGLRALCHGNLAQAVLAQVAGEPCTIEFSEEPLEFTADGQVRALAP